MSNEPSCFLNLEVCVFQGNEEFTLAQIPSKIMDQLDETRCGVPTVFAFTGDKLRVWPTPVNSEYFQVRIR